MIKAIVTDIEGTTSSLSFVKEILFPYARKRLPAFIETHSDDADVQHWLHEAAREEGLVSAEREEMIALLNRWIDEDRKATPLKALQGMIWADGYRNGEFTGHVYPEVAERLREWQKAGIKLYVYSSGSVAAQKLLYGYSDAGDLTPLFSGYFDTEVGGKRETASYVRIAEAIALPADQVLFLSDIVAELDAARAAGMWTTQLARPPATCPTDGAHPCATDFLKVSLPD